MWPNSYETRKNKPQAPVCIFHISVWSPLSRQNNPTLCHVACPEIMPYPILPHSHHTSLDSFWSLLHSSLSLGNLSCFSWVLITISPASVHDALLSFTENTPPGNKAGPRNSLPRSVLLLFVATTHCPFSHTTATSPGLCYIFYQWTHLDLKKGEPREETWRNEYLEMLLLLLLYNYLIFAALPQPAASAQLL